MNASKLKCVEVKSGLKKSSRGLIDDVGIILISLHLHLLFGFCRLEVDLILSL